jgi:hypothetical protein
MSVKFDHTIIKIDKNGQRVMSDTLYSGEKLESGETYSEVKAKLKEQGYTTGLEGEQRPTAEAGPQDGLTLDPTLTHTIGIRDVRPEDDADKKTWYEWAKTHKGLFEAYDDITKKQIIAKYGS